MSGFNKACSFCVTASALIASRAFWGVKRLANTRSGVSIYQAHTCHMCLPPCPQIPVDNIVIHQSSYLLCEFGDSCSLNEFKGMSWPADGLWHLVLKDATCKGKELLMPSFHRHSKSRSLLG
jgi:hypothetical protein